ncbi:ion transporter [Peterkaempfera bronchialis]|uniref:Ion transporter n=1 Tax=Peterkaempfera bronchialis TaxID=2126346 RepID=A0A345SUG9_9ACTN|nr:ion transporter [Peterkaempfera bronchialis]AXI77374.1 ion transporter [Peterkaempfera bronchialis]
MAGSERRTPGSQWCARVTEAPAFSGGVFLLIVANAALLGVETYPGATARWGGALRATETLFLAAFTAELALRIAARGPRAFLRDPWNVFDLLVVGAAFFPLVRENATVLRLLRLARVLRTVRLLPHVRIILVAVVRALPGTLSFTLVGGLLAYVYAMLGWMLFAGDDPAHYGSIGRAMLSLFLLMTLDGLGDAVRTGLEVSRWTFLYFASYVLFASFLLVNLLIGVVITSLEEARQLESNRERQEAGGAEGEGEGEGEGGQGRDGPEEVRERIARLRAGLDELEASLGALDPPSGGSRGRS